MSPMAEFISLAFVIAVTGLVIGAVELTQVVLIGYGCGYVMAAAVAGKP